MNQERTPHASWFIQNPDFFGFKLPLWHVQEAYNRLFIWEENTGLADGRVSFDQWLNDTDPTTKQLIEGALNTEFHWGPLQANSPLSERPSLLILNDHWLSSMGYPGVSSSIQPQLSAIFRDRNPALINIRIWLGEE